MIDGMTIGRRRLLTLTAGSVSALTLGGLVSRRAYAAEAVRWVSPRGTVEVLDLNGDVIGSGEAGCEVTIFAGRQHRQGARRIHQVEGDDGFEASCLRVCGLQLVQQGGVAQGN